jgi:CHAT domain-containing protein
MRSPAAIRTAAVRSTGSPRARKREGLTAPLPKAAALAEAKEWLRAEALKRAASVSEGEDRGPRPKLPPLEVPSSNPTTPDADRPFAHPYYGAAFVLIGDPD